MFKCEKCIFYNENGYQDMGATIPECLYIITEEQRKKARKEKYNLFKALIYDTNIAEKCKYFTYTCEIVDIIKEKVKNDNSMDIFFNNKNNRNNNKNII